MSASAQCVCKYRHKCGYICLCMWRPQNCIRGHFTLTYLSFLHLLLFIWGRITHWPGTHLLCQSGWPLRPRDLPVSLSPGQGSQAFPSPGQPFYTGDRDHTQVLKVVTDKHFKNWAISWALIINFLMHITLYRRPNFSESKYTVFVVNYDLGQVIPIFWFCSPQLGNDSNM